MRRFLHVAAFLLVISGARIAVAEEPGKDADRAAKFAERNRLWTEAQKLRDQGKIAEAIGDARKIIAIEQELLGKDHAELISSWSFIAGLAEGTEDWTNAGEARAEAWRMATVAYGKSDWRTTDARLAQEHMAHLRGRSAADRQALREASVDNSKVVRLYSAAKYDEAVKLATEVLQTRERLLGPEHPSTASSLNNLAALCESQGNYAAAEPLYLRALRGYEKTLGPEHPETAASLNNLGLLKWRIGEAEAARPLVARGLEIQLRHLDRTASIQSEQQQFLMAQTLSNHLDAWLTVTLAEGSSSAEAWGYVLAWKGLTTSRQLGLRQALKDDPTYSAYRMVGQQLSALVLSPPSPPSERTALAVWNERAPRLRKLWEERQESLQAEWERLEKELARKFAAFGQARDTARVTPELVQQQLSRAIGDAALVDLVQYWYFGRPTEKSQWRYAAFVIRADEIERVELGASEPIERQLAAGRTRDGKLLAFGRLQSAQAEPASIERRYRKKVRGESDTLEGAEATEAAFRDQAGRHEWLHVITHGFFGPETIKSALETARAASPALGFGDLNSRPRPVGVHPGLLSGLAFAGANSPPEEGKDDGILTALEVSALDLSQVDTVVLSACETGLGEVANGEGLLGLQRAFQVAGAKTVVASLWKVPDRATSALMQRFYENLWDKKMGKLAALQEAQIWMMRGKGNRGLALGDDAPDPNAPLPPYFWAAFVLSGDWR